MISLIRIDDRLIHGQVIVGWGIKLNPQKYIIIDDDIEEWESELYLGCLEDESIGEVLSTEDASKRFQDWVDCKEHVVILVKNPQTLEKLANFGVNLPDINLGGQHYLEGKKQFLNCLYLYENERLSLKHLCEKFRITYQPLPSDNKVDIRNII